jgi:hypothetical protein
MRFSAGRPLPSSARGARGARVRTTKTYLHWFIGFALTGLLYSSFAWSVLLAGNGKSRVELALQLPLKGMIRFLEWIHCPEVLAIVLEVFPPITGLAFGLLALGACWAWRTLDLAWDRAKYVLIGAGLFEGLLLAYGCASARISEPGPQGYLTLPGQGDSLLAMALTILFVCGISLIALSPHWGTLRSGDRATSNS